MFHLVLGSPDTNSFYILIFFFFRLRLSGQEVNLLSLNQGVSEKNCVVWTCLLSILTSNFCYPGRCLFFTASSFIYSQPIRACSLLGCVYLNVAIALIKK